MSCARLAGAAGINFKRVSAEIDALGGGARTGDLRGHQGPVRTVSQAMAGVTSMTRAIFLSMLLGWATGLADAHDLRGASTQEVKSASRQITKALAEAGADANTKSVLSNLRLWPVPHRLTICFLSGSAALRARVTAVMQESWPVGTLSSGRLDFDKTSFQQAADCGPQPTADIRVAFVPGDGHWSYVGIESVQHTPSMNFDAIESKPAEDFQRIVSHEMGHALGLEHEHQSPAAPKDCGWDFDYIWTHYSWKTQEEMRYNLDRLQDYVQQGRHAYRFSTYDQGSNMHYFFEPAGFTGGEKSPCFIKAQNRLPSDLDLASMRMAYGNNAHAQQEAAKGSSPTLLKLYSQPGYADLRQLIDLKSDLLGK